MKKFAYLLLLALLVGNVITGCTRCTTTKAIDSASLKLPYGGNRESLFIEQLEVRLSTATLREPLDREVSYSYIFRVNLKHGTELTTLFSVDCLESDDVDDFTAKLKISESKTREHLVIGLGNQVKTVAHQYANVWFKSFPEGNEGSFPGTLDYSENFNEIQLSELEKPRELFEEALNNEQEFGGLYNSKKIAVLMTLSPQDKLNMLGAELLFDSSSDLFSNSSERTLYIKKMQRDSKWREYAQTQIETRPSGFPLSQDDILLFYQIGGKEAIEKLDKLAVQMDEPDDAFNYMTYRIGQKHSVPLSKQQLIEFLQAIRNRLTDFCGRDPETDPVAGLKLLAENGKRDILAEYLQALEASPCFADNIGNITQEMLFFESDFRKSDRKEIVDMIFRNFGRIKQRDMYSIYGYIDDVLTCDQQKELLKKYKKGVDIFNDKEAVCS